MFTALLIIIYLSFISLGLPDSLLGSAWPAMYTGFGVSIASAGIISMTISGGTIVSSLLSEKLIRRLGTGAVTIISVAMTAVALWGISRASAFYQLLLWAIPLGLGAGSVDTALNNFVALHYRVAHMNWLHCFWGLGASAGPIVLSHYLAQTGAWRDGYGAISMAQFVLVAILLLSLPLWWKVQRSGGQAKAVDANPPSMRKAITLPGVKVTLLSFFCYCAIETTVGLWGSTFLVAARGVSADTAARWISLYYMGITAGRLVSGILSVKLASIQMLRLGQALIGIGVAILFLPFSGWPMLVGLFCIGLGCAPIFPILLHETPSSFGKDNSQVIMGMQMAIAYLGSTVVPPLFGLLGASFGYGLLPFFCGAFLVVLVAMVQMLYRRVRHAWQAQPENEKP